VWLEALGQLKNPMMSLGIEPMTFQLVAQCLNQLRYYVPPPLGCVLLCIIEACLMYVCFLCFVCVLPLTKDMDLGEKIEIT
jgi:hypothetical protein